MIEVEIAQPNGDFSLNYKLIALKVHGALLSDTVTSREFVHTNSLSASKISEKENRVFLTVKSVMNTRYGCGGRTRWCLTGRLSTVGSSARFAVPYIFCSGQSRLENIDRCTALGSLLPPPAALIRAAFRWVRVRLPSVRTIKAPRSGCFYCWCRWPDSNRHAIAGGGF